MLNFFICTLFFVGTFGQKASIGIVEENIKTLDGSEIENELIVVDLRKPNEDIKFQAHLLFHLKDGNMHLNDHQLAHNQVHFIRMMVQITDIVNGLQAQKKRKQVELRVLIEEKSDINGIKQILVEEEFTTVDGETVEQIEVQQLIWRANVRVSQITVKLQESKIHNHPRASDHSMFIPDENSVPHLPKEGDRAESGRNSTVTQCWSATHLSWKSKVALFSLGFLGLLTGVICCGLCAQRRRHHLALQVSTPMDDSVDVEKNFKAPAEKKDEKLDFHFEFDNAVVIDDKKALVEEA